MKRHPQSIYRASISSYRIKGPHYNQAEESMKGQQCQKQEAECLPAPTSPLPPVGLNFCCWGL